MFRVNRIFRSLQGESTYAGLPCTFVRLAGCDLNCKWCDTRYARSGGVPMTMDRILEQVAAFPADMIEITGGEPLCQDETPELCRHLLGFGATVLVETNNHHNIDLLPEGVIRIVDVKCPGSGEQESNDWDNLARLQAGDQVKFVVADEYDFNFVLDVVRRHRLLDKCAVLFAPVYGLCDPASLAGWILESRMPLRLQLQLHKLIWSADREDV